MSARARTCQVPWGQGQRQGTGNIQRTEKGSMSEGQNSQIEQLLDANGSTQIATDTVPTTKVPLLLRCSAPRARGPGAGGRTANRRTPAKARADLCRRASTHTSLALLETQELMLLGSNSGVYMAHAAGEGGDSCPHEAAEGRSSTLPRADQAHTRATELLASLLAEEERAITLAPNIAAA